MIPTSTRTTFIRALLSLSPSAGLRWVGRFFLVTGPALAGALLVESHKNIDGYIVRQGMVAWSNSFCAFGCSCVRMYRHVRDGRCEFHHPAVRVRASTVSVLPPADLAIMILGELRSTLHVDRFKTAFPSSTKHLFANVELFDSKKNTSVPSTHLRRWVDALRPHWWTVRSYPRIDPNCSSQRDASFHWPQFGRMYDTFEAVRQHEILGAYEYKWVVRLRSDLLNTPDLKVNIGKFEPHAVHVSGAWHNWGKDRSPRQFLPRDYYFLVPRRRADAFFSLGLDFLTCQTIPLNLRVCDGVEKWPLFPECILKTHMRACNISFHIF